MNDDFEDVDIDQLDKLKVFLELSDDATFNKHCD